MRTGRRTSLAALLVGAALVGCGGGKSGEDATGAGVLGPHGGRVLADDTLAVEIVLVERSGSPRFELHPTADGEPIAPGEITATVTTARLGGGGEQLRFAAEGHVLRSVEAVPEPHAFDGTLEATWQGERHRFTWTATEGRVVVPDAALAAAGITVADAGPRRIVSTIELPGEVALDADHVAHVVPRVAGVTTAVHVRLGDRVAAGDAMATIDSRELAEEKSEFIEAVHQLEIAQIRYLREEQLWQRRISPEFDYLVARHVLEEAEISRQIAEQKLLAIGVSRETLAALSVEPAGRIEHGEVRVPFEPRALTGFDIRAPIRGTVIEKHIVLGESVGVEREVFVLADLDTVWVEVAVPAKDLGLVRPGQAATVRSPALGLVAEGTLAYVGAVVGEATRSATARIDLPNPEGRWRPGVFVTVGLVEAASEVPVAVPVGAVQGFGDGVAVFVRYGDVFELRPVTLGRRDAEWVEVVRGLAAGERYAASGTFVLKADLGKAGAAHES